MFDPAMIPHVTEEMLLKKFNGDVYKAAAYSQVLLEFQKEKLEHSKIFLPDTPYMVALGKKIDEELDWDLLTPWWKKVLVKLGLMKRDVSITPEVLDEIYNAAVSKIKYDPINA